MSLIYNQPRLSGNMLYSSTRTVKHAITMNFIINYRHAVNEYEICLKLYGSLIATHI